MDMNDIQIKMSPYADDAFMDHAILGSGEGPHRPGPGGVFPLTPFTYTGWMDEELAWHDTCSLHMGLNPFMFLEVEGADYLRMLTDFSVNTFKKFPVGKARHVIFCNDEGKLTNDGILIRLEEERFLAAGLLNPDFLNACAGGAYDVKVRDVSGERAFYQLCGPRSLEVVEAATRSDLHDIKFMWERDAKIGDADVMILRTGMAGSLGYEVHCYVADAIPVFKALMAAGEPYGLRRIGTHAYRNCHTEGSIPQGGTHFVNAPATWSRYPAPAANEGEDDVATQFSTLHTEIVGSMDPDSELIYRSPVDLGWEKMVRFGHDFPGKEALEAELAGRHRTMAHVRWNQEDLLRVYASYFTDDPADMMEWAEDYDFNKCNFTIYMDGVYAPGTDTLVGASSGRMYSPKNHEMHSMCTLDTDYAEPGSQVEVLWGRPGTHQMRIRAEVIPTPYITKCRNDSFDVEQIPHPKFD